MRIYVCVPKEIFADDNCCERLRRELHGAMEEYYVKFDSSCIQFFRSEDSTANLYVMEKALKPEHDDKIIEAVRKLFGCPVEVHLNYQALNPNFEPVSEIPSPGKKIEDEIVKLSQNYHAEAPLYTFEQVILPEETQRKIDETIAMMTRDVKQKVFKEWGLRNIVPHPVSALNFYGLPGTGKTMAAEAVAHMLKKPIIRASYADIESKYHGEGPKRVKAVFMAAERDDAVLFIDEADSLLSKRLTDVSNGSEQAINSMRSQLLIAVEHFEGVVIFATNLIVNYDKAFVSRLVCIEIPAPDTKGRQAIWEQHLRGKGISIPLSDDVSTQELAEKYDKDFHGREIRKAVIRACVYAAKEKHEAVTHSVLLEAAEAVRIEAEKVQNASDHTQSTLKGLLQKKIDGRRAMRHEGTSFWRYRYHPRYREVRKISQD